MPKIELVQIDTHEPDWIQALNFDGAYVAPKVNLQPVSSCDLYCMTDEGNTLLIERKEIGDLLNTLGSNDPSHQLFVQLGRMAQPMYDEQNLGKPQTIFCYLFIIGAFSVGRDNKITTANRGVTGWNWASVMGALLTAQEAGIQIVFVENDSDYESAVLSLGKREKTGVKNVLPPRPISILGDRAIFIQGLAKGIGEATAQKILTHAGDNPAVALAGITDMSIKYPLSDRARLAIRAMLGLEDGYILEIVKGE